MHHISYIIKWILDVTIILDVPVTCLIVTCFLPGGKCSEIIKTPDSVINYKNYSSPMTDLLHTHLRVRHISNAMCQVKKFHVQTHTYVNSVGVPSHSILRSDRTKVRIRLFGVVYAIDLYHDIEWNCIYGNSVVVGPLLQRYVVRVWFLLHSWMHVHCHKLILMLINNFKKRDLVKISFYIYVKYILSYTKWYLFKVGTYVNSMGVILLFTIVIAGESAADFLAGATSLVVTILLNDFHSFSSQASHK